MARAANKSLDAIRRHDRRWGNVETDTNAFESGKNRIRALILSFFNRSLDSECDQQFAFLMGLRIDGSDVGIEVLDGNGGWHVLRELDACTTSTQVARVMYVWLQALEARQHRNRAHFADRLREVFEYAPALGIRLLMRGVVPILVPLGARLLDDKLVEDVVDWLRCYPATAEHFEKALEFYQSGDRKKHRDLLDNLRCALEQLLKAVLRNKKSLENQKQLMLRWLSERGLHPQVTNMFERLISQFCDYQNQAVKHGSEYGEDEIEFMIYLTGTFMRLVLRLNGT